jgi:hypothetical protein
MGRKAKKRRRERTKWEKYRHQGRGRSGVVELRLPFPEHLVHLLFQDAHIHAAVLPPGLLQAAEHALEVLDAALGLHLEGVAVRGGSMLALATHRFFFSFSFPFFPRPIEPQQESERNPEAKP